jgi:hypothetical protein
MNAYNQRSRISFMIAADTSTLSVLSLVLIVVSPCVIELDLNMGLVSIPVVSALDCLGIITDN